MAHSLLIPAMIDVVVRAGALMVPLGTAADPGEATRDGVRPSDGAIQRVCDGTVFVPFVADDATGAIQAALDGNACTVVLRDVGEPWVSGPLFIQRDNVRLVLEPGAELVAKLGAFPELGNALIRVNQAKRVSILGGEGSAIRMLNGIDPDYLDGEWRHTISIVRGEHVRIAGLTLADSGGDGVFVGGNWLEDENHRPSRGVLIEDCLFEDHRRQGVSVISVDGLLIRRCTFRDIGATSGTDPMAGIDFEPDIPVHQLIDCRVEDCVFIDNRGSNYSTGVHSYLGNLDETSSPVDITLERLDVTSAVTDGSAVAVRGPNTDAGPPTTFVLRDITIDTTRGIGLLISSNALHTSVLLERVTLSNTHRDAPAWLGAPIYLEGQLPGIGEYGGITFVDCTIVDDRARPFIKVYEDRDHVGMPPSNARNISGNIRVINPNPEGRVFDLHFENDVGIDLIVE